MLLHESAHTRIEWLEDDKILLKQFNGYVGGREMREAFNAGYEAMRTHNGCKWLSDNRYLKPYQQADVDWINTDWFPRMMDIGWKYWGIVEPVSIMGNLSMRSFINLYRDQGLVLNVFDSIKEGRAWLNSM
ncbi:hypothetical protein KQI52_13320 [bacterium]|nr:hypothetical protein [bacterium]